MVKVIYLDILWVVAQTPFRFDGGEFVFSTVIAFGVQMTPMFSDHRQRSRSNMLKISSMACIAI